MVLASSGWHRIIFASSLVLAAAGYQPAAAQLSPPATIDLPIQVLSEARSKGVARVIVGLDVAEARDTALAGIDSRAARDAIAAAQASALALVPRVSAAARRFAYSPYFAAEMTEAELRVLAASRGVTRIVPDAIAAPTLAQSAPLVGAPTAWAAGFTGAGLTIAVLDSGVDKAHPFLGGRIVAEACYSSTTVSFNSTSVCPGGVAQSTAPGSGLPCSMADCEHGTHVAGIAAGRGVASGIAPDATVIAIQVFSSFASGCAPNPTPCPGSFTSDQILGLERVYALRATYRIAAVNMSLGGGFFETACDTDPRKDIIDRLRAAGIATVIASGNSGFTTALAAPACISSAISVGSTTDGSSGTAADQVSTFTNSSPFLTLLAPGEAITSSVPGGGFATFAGTSMAAPHVAGAWAVLLQRNPGATVTEIENALVNTGVPITDPGNGLVKPRLNLAAALPVLAPVCSYTVTPGELQFPRAGGSATIAVTTTPGCAWSASSSAAFVSVSCASGLCVNQLVVTVLPNPGTSARRAVIDVSGAHVSIAQAGVSLGDMSGDGKADLVWQNVATGSLATWYLDGFKVVSTLLLGASPVTDLNWRIAATGDLDGDGFADLVWQHRLNGSIAVWFMNGTRVLSTQFLSIPAVADTNWQIVGATDADGDGKADLLWQHVGTGALAAWFMSGSQVRSTQYLSIPVVDPVWRIAGAGDTDGDGHPEIIWQNRIDGRLAIWTLNGTQVSNTRALGIDRMNDLSWQIRGVGDVDGDGRCDLIWQNDLTGGLGVWLLNGAQVTLQRNLSIDRVPDTNWKVVGPG